MVLKQYECDENRYLHIFSQQHGYGMPKFRGSPMIGGSFWGRIGFAKGLFSKAAPHISSAIAQAQPHVKNLASRALESAIDTAVEKVTEKLKSAGQNQEGRGRRKKHIKAAAKSRKRIPRPSDQLPDKV